MKQSGRMMLTLYALFSALWGVGSLWPASLAYTLSPDLSLLRFVFALWLGVQSIITAWFWTILEMGRRNPA